MRPLAPLNVLIAALALALPAQAGQSPTQAVKAALDLPLTSSRVLEACLGTDCTSVLVPTGTSGPLVARLVYTVAADSRLPDLDVAAGAPSTCEVGEKGTTTRRPGIALRASGGKLRDQSTLEVKIGQTTIKALTKHGVRESTEPLDGRVCLLG